MSRSLALRLSLGLVILLAAVSVAGLLVVRSSWFFDQVRARIVREIEDATGGTAEMSSFWFDWTTLTAEVRGLVVHGLEPEGEDPLFAARRVTVGLKLISALRRKIDIASLEVEEPRIAIIVDAGGRTNIPAPKAARASPELLAQFLDFAVGRYRIADGRFKYRSEEIPLDAEGENLEAVLSYDPTGPAYECKVSTDALQVRRPLATPLALDLRATMRLDKDRLLVSQSEIGTEQSRLSARGSVDHFEHLAGAFDVEGRLALEDFVPVLRLPVQRRGEVHLSGKASFDGTEWSSQGSFQAQGIAYRGGGVEISGIAAEGPYRAENTRLVLDGVLGKALGGEFSGSVEMDDWSRFSVKGDVRDFALGRLNEARMGGPLVWTSTVAGAIEVQGAFAAGGMRDWAVSAGLNLEPSGQGVPLSGNLGLEMDSRTGIVRFQPSRLTLPSSRAEFQGDIRDGISVDLTSRNLDDFLPALAMLSAGAPRALPARLAGGTAEFQGTLRGDWKSPQVTGQVSTGPFLAEGRSFQRAEAAVELVEGRLRLEDARLVTPAMTLSGGGTLALDQWRLTPESEIRGSVSLAAAPIEGLLRENDLHLPLHGRVEAAGAIQGTFGDPEASFHVIATQLVAWGETLDRLESDLHYEKRNVDFTNTRGRAGAGVVQAAGLYRPTGQDWSQGELRVQTSGRGWRVQRLVALRDYLPKVDGDLSWTAAGAVRVTSGEPELASLEGKLTLEQASLSGRTVGSLSLSAGTVGRLMTVNAQATLGGATVQGGAEWRLERNSYGLGQLQISNLTFRSLREIGVLGDPDKELPFEGSIEAEVGFSGPVLDPRNWTAAAKITQFEMQPSWQGRGEAAGRPWILRNQDPLLAYVDHLGVHVDQARVVGDGTDLQATGIVAFRSRNPWNLAIKGSISLPVLSRIEPDLTAEGVSTIDASIRGTLDQPQVNGTMELKDASLSMRGLPNGITHATGRILFDRTRATIDQFSAQTGGGDITLGGFIGFGGDTPVYRLQATTERVRVRYPEAVSTTFDSALSLTGTSTRSLLSGSVTVTKLGIAPGADIGSLLMAAGRGVTTPVAPNEFLRNMQIDVHVETSADAQLQTSLTQDIRPDADLRLRGSPYAPVLLGRVSVNQGEIQFFGNRYTITHGDIGFFNPVKIEPVLNLDLETRVRGITVTINVAGPSDKLNVSYRSDPPLSSEEIIALLTVGRTPGSLTAPSTGTSSQGLLSSGGNSLLGQAVTAPLTGPLQRLFGVSRLKIDPDLTGVTNTPQARVTIEQQLSRDVTITYITNLNRTQQQIVRLQWDFSRDFSVVAVRDENGIFGIDFQYRRRFD